MNLELRLLRHAVALADHGNFARAARSLLITQPSLSRSIQLLESRIGGQLFERNPGGVEPTEYGRLFLRHARDVLATTEHFEREIALVKGIERGRLSIGAGPYPAEMIVAPAIGRFITDHPRIQTRLFIKSWNELPRELRARDLDLFVAAFSEIVSEAEFEITPLHPHPIYFVARAGHPLAAARRVDLRAVLQYPLVAPARIPPHMLGEFLKHLPRETDSPASEVSFPAIQCDSLSAALRIVLTSDAISVFPLSFIRGELAAGRLAVLHQEAWLQIVSGIVHLRARKPSPAARAFIQRVLDLNHEVKREEDKLRALYVKRRRSREGG